MANKFLLYEAAATRATQNKMIKVIEYAFNQAGFCIEDADHDNNTGITHLNASAEITTLKQNKQFNISSGELFANAAIGNGWHEETHVPVAIYVNVFPNEFTDSDTDIQIEEEIMVPWVQNYTEYVTPEIRTICELIDSLTTRVLSKLNQVTRQYIAKKNIGSKKARALQRMRAVEGLELNESDSKVSYPNIIYTVTAHTGPKDPIIIDTLSGSLKKAVVGFNRLTASHEKDTKPIAVAVTRYSFENKGDSDIAKLIVGAATKKDVKDYVEYLSNRATGQIRGSDVSDGVTVDLVCYFVNNADGSPAVKHDWSDRFADDPDDDARSAAARKKAALARMRGGKLTEALNRDPRFADRLAEIDKALKINGWLDAGNLTVSDNEETLHFIANLNNFITPGPNDPDIADARLELEINAKYSTNNLILDYKLYFDRIPKLFIKMFSDMDQIDSLKNLYDLFMVDHKVITPINTKYDQATRTKHLSALINKFIKLLDNWEATAKSAGTTTASQAAQPQAQSRKQSILARMKAGR